MDLRRNVQMVKNFLTINEERLPKENRNYDINLKCSRSKQRAASEIY
jgi:hypothetical protein